MKITKKKTIRIICICILLIIFAIFFEYYMYISSMPCKIINIKFSATKNNKIEIKKVSTDLFYDKYGINVYTIGVKNIKYNFRRDKKNLIKNLNNFEYSVPEFINALHNSARDTQDDTSKYSKDDRFEKYEFETITILIKIENGDIYIVPADFQYDGII